MEGYLNIKCENGCFSKKHDNYVHPFSLARCPAPPLLLLTQYIIYLSAASFAE